MTLFERPCITSLFLMDKPFQAYLREQGALSLRSDGLSLFELRAGCDHY